MRQGPRHCILNRVLRVTPIAKNKTRKIVAGPVVPVNQLSEGFLIACSSLFQQYLIAGNTNLHSVT